MKSAGKTQLQTTRTRLKEERDVKRKNEANPMDKLSKTSTTYYLSEYLEDLSRAGVRDFYRGESNAAPVASSATPSSALEERRPIETEKIATQTSTQAAANANRDAEIEPQTERRLREVKVSTNPSVAEIATFSNETAANADERSKRLRVVAEEVSRCSQCAALVANRTQTVFGSGNPCAELVFVGEGPGADEDEQGLPFVGRSGKLLTDMIEKGMGIPRATVFICNVVRCRPPQNRNPNADEAKACRPFLDATLEIIRPKFICCLGTIAAQNLLGVDVPIGKLRGKVCDYRGAKVVCTYHPAYLLRNPPAKKQTWDDLQLLMREMGLAVPQK